MLESLIVSLLPLASVMFIAGLVLSLGHYFLLVRHKSLGSEARLPRQLALLFLSIMSILAMILVAPLPDSTRNQILGLFGIVLSGSIAFSSTSFVTNFMAAVMLRVTKPFSVGDFIQVGEFFGKVSERGLFDTEIQTENRELVAIPNSTFINLAVTVTRSSGVIISTTLSLGYDISFEEVEPHMLKAARNAGLSDPYVHIKELGDFSISYRVCGLLADVEGMLTARSLLNHQLLKILHSHGLEVVSPTVTRHINQDVDTRIIPKAQPIKTGVQSAKAEEIVFDKAREIERLELSKKDLTSKL
ncbi:MAG: mechanosensitive ion channel domain-containing protein, partial [Halioglobus sp.]